MALPKELKALFAGLPQARAEKQQRAEQARLDEESAKEQAEAERQRQREALRAELSVAWDWLEGDGQELAAEFEKAGILRLEVLGPLDPEGREVPWQLDARVLLLNQGGQLEVVRSDPYRELRYPVRTMEDFLRIEPPSFTRAFVEAVRTGALYERVARHLRESTRDEPRRVDE